MGIYLNPGSAGFRESIQSQIYVDKTENFAAAARAAAKEVQEQMAEQLKAIL